MVHRYIQGVFEAFANNPDSKGLKAPPTVLEVGDVHRQNLCTDLVGFAQSKLLRQEHVPDDRSLSPKEAQAAVLDVRIMLSYEPSQEDARQQVVELIESHMRTVYSVPRGREYFRSGYSSEPILVEAAAKQLHRWRTNQTANHLDPALAILKDNLNHDLLSRGELGEATGRLLLMRARDAAAVREAPNQNNVLFSRAVSLTTFIEELFPRDLAEQILESCPDNLNTTDEHHQTTFRAMFHHAVINFTHFAK